MQTTYTRCEGYDVDLDAGWDYIIVPEELCANLKWCLLAVVFHALPGASYFLMFVRH